MRQDFSDGTDTDQLTDVGGRSDRRRSATGGEQVGNVVEENRSRGFVGRQFRQRDDRERRFEVRREELALGEMLDDAVVIRRVVLRVQARVGSGADREKTERHHGKHHQHCDEESRGGDAL